MNITKNDVSCCEVKIDYDALLKSMKYAYAMYVEQIYIKAHNMLDTKVDAGTPYDVYQIESDARKLRVIVETLETLQDGVTREKKEFVNIPKEA